MSNNNNQLNIPQAREAGSVEGQMVKTKCPTRTKFDRNIWTVLGHIRTVEYIATISIKKGPPMEVPFVVISQMQFYAG